MCDRSVDVLILRVRRKLEADPANPRLIKQPGAQAIFSTLMWASGTGTIAVLSMVLTTIGCVLRTGHRRSNNGNQDLRECSGFLMTRPPR